MSFKKYYSQAQFETYIHCYMQENLDRNQYHELCDDFANSLFEFLLELNKEGKLASIAYSAGHNTDFSQAWNLLLDNKKDKYFYRFEKNFYKLMSGFGTKKDITAWTQEDFDTKYIQFVEKINKGDFHYFEMGEDCHQCHDCAQKFNNFNFKNWQGQYSIINYDYSNGFKNMKTTESIPKSCLPKGNLSVEVEFETGEVYFADWFRIPEFTKSVEDTSDDKYTSQKSLNFKPGIIYSIERFAKEFNFISVNIGNSCPKLCLDNDSIVVGYLDEDEDDKNETKYQIGGRICTDLWNGTLIDKQQLIALVSTQIGDKAQEIVELYLKENDVPKILVAPGKYILNYNPICEDFDNHFKNDEEKIYPSNMQKFFTLNKVVDYKSDKKIKMK